MFWEKNYNAFSLSENGWIELIIVSSERAPWELSNNGHVSRFLTILKFFGQFLCPALGEFLGDKSHHPSLKS
jgi:cytosine/uracil/thiamine/allantoin permease